MSAVKVLLNRGEKILIYPEQAMWWNYRKPRPHKKGAYRIAVNNNAPIIPFFITMEDSEIIGGDGFPVQEYIVHIAKAIYPKSDLNKNENMEYLKAENEKVCKETYEQFYGVKLKFEE
jgi:1-acyl-sn-glycerol-3-phosphate acyltransferase